MISVVNENGPIIAINFILIAWTTCHTKILKCGGVLFMSQFLLPSLCTVENNTFMRDNCYSTISDSRLAMGSFQIHPHEMADIMTLLSLEVASSRICHFWW